VEGGKVYGLGANDAKAAAAAMIAGFLAVAAEALPVTLALALVEGEETTGRGTRQVLATLAERGLQPAAAVIGEPTGLDLAVAEKGLVVLELVARGDACHAAHARALGARNAVRLLARDLVALEGVDLGPAHPLLGAATLEPTQLEGGTARNVVPAEARVVLDSRVTPTVDSVELVRRVRKLAGECEVRVLSDRLQPREVAETAPIVRAARAARPEARLYGSPTLSDWARLDGVPAVKCGPGESRRSHTADEYVLEEEALAGARFYRDLVREFARLMAGPGEGAGRCSSPGGAP
jgi:acetylornithine deacetylase